MVPVVVFPLTEMIAHQLIVLEFTRGVLSVSRWDP